MSNVYYKKVNSETSIEEIQQITRELLDTIIKEENITLENTIPLKVHFGEKGNSSYIQSKNFEGIINYLKDNNIETCYIETSVLYGGQRGNKNNHIQLALDHGFTQVPVIIADGERGEAYTEVEINKKHFKYCKLGKDFEKYKQMIILSHFKGHMMAGFGGVMKQLSMGYASKGGKLAMHMDVKPRIISRKCKQCNLCKTRCREDAITIGKKSFINYDKCVGCGACVSICPHKAVTIMSLEGMYTAVFKKSDFLEKLMEYAYAAHKDKQNIYINFVMNVTKGCDCEPRKMKPIMEDIGIFISLDPLAIDKACYDIVAEKGKAFKGFKQFAYAEKINLGSLKYNLVEI